MSIVFTDKIKTSEGPKMSYYNGYDEILVYKNDLGEFTFDYTNREFNSEIKHYDSFAKLLKRIKLK